MANSNIIFSRKSALYSNNFNQWVKVLAAYSGGDKYIKKALIRHVSENKLEFAERLKRCIYLNYPRKISKLIVEFIFSKAPDRTGVDSDVQKDMSRTGLNADQVFMLALLIRLLFGRCWLLVDMPAIEAKPDMETKQKQKIRPYVRPLLPFDVVDWAYGSDGKLLWAIVQEFILDKSDPLQKPKEITQRRIWYRDRWELYQKDADGQKLVASKKHKLGFVPIKEFVEVDVLNLTQDHWMFDIVKISDAILNAGSELQMNIIKQMFGLLVVSQGFAAAMGNAEVPEYQEQIPQSSREKTIVESEGKKLAHVIARSAAIWETAEEKGLTRYIAPSGAESASIISYMSMLKDAMNDILRLALQSSSKAAQTAESKEWDSLNIQQMLSTNALSLQELESEVWEMVHAWDKSIPIPKVSYTQDFSINDLKTMVSCLMDISSFEITDEFKRAVYEKALVILDKIDPLSPEQYQKILNEIKGMTIEKQELPGMRGIDDLMKLATKNKEGANKQ